MNYFKQLIKSKTFDFNVFAGLSLGMLGQFGVDVPVEYVAPAMGFVNVFLRMVTTKAIRDK